MKQPVAVISGASGQDSFYLASLLLSKNYKVIGIVRRNSTSNLERLQYIIDHPNLILEPGDLTDFSSIERVICKYKPDEFYNLGAQSHVRESFDIPVTTANITGMGALYCLEAIRLHKPDTRFYQASSSEMFGNQITENGITILDENSSLIPRSPYGVAKIFAHQMTRNYREAYGLFACAGILMNHESILKNSPILISDNNEYIDILPIEDLFKSESHRYEGLKKEFIGLNIWNGESWTKIINGTCYQDKNKNVRLIQTRESCYEATDDHVVFNKDNQEIYTKDIVAGDHLFRTSYPKHINILSCDIKLAKFIGFMIGDGYIADDGRMRLTGVNKQEIENIANLVLSQFGWDYRLSTHGHGQFENCTKDIWQLDINNDRNFGHWLRREIYTNSGEKKVPKFILNASQDIQQAFWEGYYLADGRKQGNEKYEYKGFTTASATLCLGLVYILKNISPLQLPKVKCEYRELDSGEYRRYYYCQLTCDYDIKSKNEVIKITNTKSENGWFFDLQTESQTFATGPNLVKIHNSPLRGEMFVTRKITKAVAQIKNGKVNKVKFGNLDSKRDWGHAADYVNAMFLMLQQDKPDDFLIASGETHSCREFLETSARFAGVQDIYNYIEYDEKLYRPTEIDVLLGNASKAKQILGWSPTINFSQLVEDMTLHDIIYYSDLPDKFELCRPLLGDALCRI